MVQDWDDCLGERIADGRLWHSCDIPVMTLVSVVHRDISERKRSERDRAKPSDLRVVLDTNPQKPPKRSASTCHRRCSPAPLVHLLGREGTLSKWGAVLDFSARLVVHKARSQPTCQFCGQ
jgi:hypothetical protein